MRSLARESIAGVLGNGAAQLVSLATVPIITRLYKPEAYGILATFLSLLALFMPIAALRLNSAIVLPKLHRHAFYLRRASYCAATLLAVVVGVIATAVGFPREYLPSGIDDLWANGIALFLSLGVLMMGWQQTEIGWLVRKRKFDAIAWARVTETGTDKSLSIIGALVIGPYAIVLLACRVLGLCFSWGQLRAVTRNADSQELPPHISQAHILAALSRRKSFPLLFTWGYLAEAIGRNSPLVIMAMYYTPSAIGMYALALMVAGLPLVLLGDSLAQVFFRAASENMNDRTHVKVVASNIVTVILCVSVPPILLLMSLGTDLFSLVFGGLWRDGGVLAAIIAGAGPVALAHRVLGCLYEIYERPYIRLLSDIGAAVVKVVLVFAAASSGVGVLYLVGLVAMIGAIGYGAALQVVLKKELHVGVLGIINWRPLSSMLPLLFATVLSFTAGFRLAIVVGVWCAAFLSFAYMLTPSVMSLFATPLKKV